MKSDNVIDFKRREQEETEKVLFGGEIYKHKDGLPIIELDASNLDKYERHLLNLENIGIHFSNYIQKLFIQVVDIYEIKTKEDLSNPIKGLIQQATTHTIGRIGNALIQIKSIREMIKDKNYVTLTGDDYCFIPLMLQDLYSTYSMLFQTIFLKRYLDENFTASINEILSFLVSKAYEELREDFKTLECFAVADGTLDLTNPITIH